MLIGVTENWIPWSKFGKMISFFLWDLSGPLNASESP